MQADRETCKLSSNAQAHPEACELYAVQAHWEASPSQLLQLLMSLAPQFKINPALPGIATIFSLPLRFSCRLPPTSLT